MPAVAPKAIAAPSEPAARTPSSETAAPSEPAARTPSSETAAPSEPAARTPSSEAAEAPKPAAPPAGEPAAPPDAALVYFRVQGVAADDALNIRFRADANARVRGTIPASARHVEGIGAPTVAGATRWQRVRHGGTIGWVNARFLAPDAAAPGGAPSAPPSVLVPLICFGTEPFWDLRFGADGSVTCGAMCEGPPGLRLASLRVNPSGEPDTFDVHTADQRIYLRAAMRRTGECSDGMSDFVYPYEFAGAGVPGALDGCCRVAAEKLVDRP